MNGNFSIFTYPKLKRLQNDFSCLSDTYNLRRESDIALEHPKRNERQHIKFLSKMVAENTVSTPDNGSPLI